MKTASDVRVNSSSLARLGSLARTVHAGTVPTLLALTLLAVGACDGSVASGTAALPDAGDAKAQPSPPTTSVQPTRPATCPPSAVPSCGPTTHVDTAAAFLAIAAKQPWQQVSTAKSFVLGLSEDLVADATLEIDATELADAPNCSTVPSEDGLPAQCHRVLLRAYAFPLTQGPGRVPGITCIKAGPRPVGKSDTCARIAIASGTTFRMRAVIEDNHPGSPTYWPFVEFERPCATLCDADEARCPATQTCLKPGRDTCAFCDARSQLECPCADVCGNKPENTQCFVRRGTDYSAEGTCRAGVCETIH